MHVSRINEMGLDLNKIPKSYLGTSAAASAKLRAQNEQIQLIVNDVKALTWQDIEFEIEGTVPSGRKFYVKLPKPIIAKIKTYRDSFPDANHGESFGSWHQLDGHGVAMETEGDSSFRRSHFPNNGIPEPLRGTGLGYKIYRKLLEITTYLRSDTSGTELKNNVWASLIKQRPDPDDVHAIVSAKSVFAMIKTLTNAEKLALTTRYLSSSYINIDQITPDSFDIDDELKSILPKDLIKGLMDPKHRDKIRKLKEESDRLQRQQQVDELAERNRTLFTTFGIGEVDTQWSVGDFVVRFTFLNDPTAKIRIVVNYNGIKAISIADYIKLTMSGRLESDLIYRVPDREEWTKIDISAIGNLNDVRLSQAEKVLVRTLVQRGELTAPDPGSGTLDLPVVASSNEYGPLIRVHDTSDFIVLLGSRTISDTAIRKITQGSFVSEIYLSPAQEERFNSRLCSEVFIPFNGVSTNMRKPLNFDVPEKVINSISGFIYSNPSSEKFTIKQITPIARKTDLQIGEMVYIANHREYFGLVAKVGMTIRNANGEDYAMLVIQNPNLGPLARRKIPIPLSNLRKIA